MNRHVVLVAEDDDGDYFLLQRGFKRADFKTPVVRVSDGQQVVDYLMGATPYSDRVAYPFPTLLLLDLKMPLKHGFDVLRWIRSQSDSGVCLLPTIIFSSSSRPEDVQTGFHEGANAFLTKPTSTEAMTEVIHALELFWIRLNCSNIR